MDKKKASSARVRANNKWNAKAYDDLKVRVQKGQRQVIKDFAERHGYSVNGFILEAVQEKMERMKQEEEK